MFLPAGRHPYISVLKQIRDVETTGIIFNSFVTNGFLRWYITTELLSLFPSMIWWKITFKTTNYNYKRKVLNTKKKYYDGYGSGLRRIRRRHEGNKATEKSSFVCSLFSVPLSLEPAITFRADLCPSYCLGRNLFYCQGQLWHLICEGIEVVQLKSEWAGFSQTSCK